MDGGGHIAAAGDEGAHHQLGHGVGVGARRVEDHDAGVGAFVDGDVVGAGTRPGDGQQALGQGRVVHVGTAHQDSLGSSGFVVDLKLVGGQLGQTGGRDGVQRFDGIHSCASSPGYWCVFAELFHEDDQFVHALGGHGVVDGGPHAAHQAVALQVDEPCLGGGGAEGLVGVGVGAGEGHVHQAAVFLLHGVVVEVLAVQIVVEHLGLGLVAALHLFQAAHLMLQVVHDQAGHVDAPAGRGVVHAVLGQQGGVVHHGGDLLGGEALGALAQQVLPDDGDGHAGGGDVLLHAEVDDAVLAHVHRLGADHRAHVRHQRECPPPGGPPGNWVPKMVLFWQMWI